MSEAKDLGKCWSELVVPFREALYITWCGLSYNPDLSFPSLEAGAKQLVLYIYIERQEINKIVGELVITFPGYNIVKYFC